MKMLFGVTVLLYFIKILGGSRQYYQWHNIYLQSLQNPYSICQHLLQ